MVCFGFSFFIQSILPWWTWHFIYTVRDALELRFIYIFIWVIEQEYDECECKESRDGKMREIGFDRSECLHFGRHWKCQNQIFVFLSHIQYTWKSLAHQLHQHGSFFVFALRISVQLRQIDGTEKITQETESLFSLSNQFLFEWQGEGGRGKRYSF